MPRSGCSALHGVNHIFLMSFVTNFNILVGIWLGPTDLLESNVVMTLSISVL